MRKITGKQLHAGNDHVHVARTTAHPAKMEKGFATLPQMVGGEDYDSS